MTDFTHFDEHGASRMVDVSKKPVTERIATASALVRMLPSTAERIQRNEFKKGDVLAVARLAGIQAAKRTDELIPLCHILPLESVELAMEFVEPTLLKIEVKVCATAKTGVEMEALTAASVAALTVYDMCKSVDRAMVIEQIRLEEKSGGASGRFKREE